MNQSNSSGLSVKRLTGNRTTEYIITFLVVLILFIIFRLLGFKNNGDAVKPIIMIALMCVGFYAFLKQKKQQLSVDDIVNLIALAGMIIGVGYMLSTHIFENGIDQGYVSANARGHFGYILNIVEGHLPNSNSEQFYQPPLVHSIAAIFVKLSLLFNGGDAEDAVQSVQIVNCTAMCFMMIAFRNFISEINLDNKSKPYVMAMAAFFPNFYLMGCRANNDMFATYFMLLCVINTCRWYQKRDTKSIVFLALSFGFGMMSKISCGVVAFLTGPVMLYVLIKDIKAGNYKNTVMQLAIFAVICLPLALWYPIRNMIMFGQSLTYVQRLDENIPIFTGKVPLYQRMLRFSITALMKKPFFVYPEFESVPEYLLKTSLFGEWSFKANGPFGAIFLIVNLTAILASAASCVYVTIKGKVIPAIYRFGFAALWVIELISYIQFNIQFPFICTADFRYVAVTELVGAIYLGYAIGLLRKDKNRKSAIISGALQILIILFAFMTIAVFV